MSRAHAIEILMKCVAQSENRIFHPCRCLPPACLSLFDAVVVVLAVVVNLTVFISLISAPSACRRPPSTGLHHHHHHHTPRTPTSSARLHFQPFPFCDGKRVSLMFVEVLIVLSLNNLSSAFRQSLLYLSLKLVTFFLILFNP